MRLIFFVLAILLALGPAAAATRAALAIGNGDDLHGPGVDAALADARAVAQAFRELGFERVTDVLECFRRRAARADVAVMYLVGQGAEIDGVNHLPPVHARLHKPVRFDVDTTASTDAFDAVRPARRIDVVLIDAYRLNDFAETVSSAGREAAGGGDVATQQTAIDFAAPHAVVKVRPGVCREALTMVRPIELIGDGPRSAIVIEARDGDALRWSASSGRVSDLTISQVGPERSDMGWGAVYIDGSGVIENCDASSVDGAVVQVLGRFADPVVRRNRIHGDAETGLSLRQEARGLYERKKIVDNASSGVEVLGGGTPVFRNNVIEANQRDGVFVALGGAGAFVANQLVGNGRHGFVVESAGAVTARRSVVSSNAMRGVRLGAEGGGAFFENDRRGNGDGAWRIEADAGALERDGNVE